MFRLFNRKQQQVMELFSMGEELCYPQVRGAAD
jgi:hypothetical protein